MRKLLSLLLLTGLGVTLSSHVSAQEPFLHPHCFADFSNSMFSGEGVDAEKPLNCDPELTKLPVETHTWDKQGEQQTSFSSDNPEDPEYPGYAGFNSYSLFRSFDTGDGGELAFLELMFNTGGSGHFGLLAMVKKEANGEAFPLWWQWAGDRCNDGYPNFIGMADDQLFYSIAATPFRLLNPLDDTDWRMQSMLEMLNPDAAGNTPTTLGGWQPYDDIANCAACCAGERIYAMGLTDGFSRMVGVKLDKEAFVSESQGDVQACVNQWFSQSEFADIGRDQLVEFERWQPALKQIQTNCKR